MKYISLLLCFCIYSVYSFSQDYSFKYGKVTMDELNMSVYDRDTTASAVVIYEDVNLSYTLGPDWFQTVTDVKQKIKILNQDGFDEADISIPYYSRLSRKDRVTNLEAYTYNQENGKVEKLKLDKKYIFDEEVNAYTRQIKFSMPGVKAGSVIEFKYKVTSDNIYTIPDREMQKHIPVIYSYYEVLIPEYYEFNVDATRGFEKISVTDGHENQRFTISSGGQSATVNSNSRLMKFKAEYLPAMKDEPYVWCVDDYISAVRFEIKGTRFPGQIYKPYTKTWETLEEMLIDDSDFGQNLKISNPYKNELKLLLEAATTEEEKINIIYLFVKSRIRWNELYAFWGDKARETAKNGVGNNAQINMVLISALKDAGINTYPVLLSRRQHGRLPLVYPSLNKINTFIVCAETTEGKRYYMDGSAVYGGPNMLPVGLLVDRGRVMNAATPEKWVDLTGINKNQELTVLTAEINDGVLTGEKSSKYTNQSAYGYKAAYYSKKDSLDYIESIENKHNVKITDMATEGNHKMSAAVTETIKFTKQLESSGEYLYLNPMIFTHIASNQFVQSERKLPIEFNYPYNYTLSCTMKIPDGYEVEELPKPLNMQLEEKGGRLTYNITQNGNTIQLLYRFNLNQVIFLSTSYENIRDFFGQMVAKNHEQVVLKKKNAE